MMIKKYKDQIIANGNQEVMEELGDMFVDVMYKLKECNKECFDKYKKKLYVLAYGKVLTEEMAEEKVFNMKPDGQHWSIDETTTVKAQAGLSSISPVDFYIVMNMAWNDYKDIFGDNLDMYINYSKAFILDQDAKDGKVFTYFTEIPKE